MQSLLFRNKMEQEEFGISKSESHTVATKCNGFCDWGNDIIYASPVSQAIIEWGSR